MEDSSQQFDAPPQNPERQSKRAQLGSLWNSFSKEKTPEPAPEPVPELPARPIVEPIPQRVENTEEPAQEERVGKRAQWGSMFNSFTSSRPSSRSKTPEPVSKRAIDPTPEPIQQVEQTMVIAEPVTKRAQLESLFFSSRSKTPEPTAEPGQDAVAEPVPEQLQEQIENSEPLGKRAQLSALMQTGWGKGLVVGREQLATAALSLEHSLGLGQKPSVVPPGEASIDGEHRTVEIGWHPVAGMSGKWFADKTGLGRYITKEVGKYPDPSQHWGVLVGDYVHQLWMDENLDVIYFNEKLVREDWRTFEVGKTRFSDQALQEAAEMTIHNMRTKRPAYNIISNNCQNFATLLLDAIQIGAHHEFATSFAVYQRATGAGLIKDLFVDKHPEEQKTDVPAVSGVPGPGKLQRADTVSNAQAVMNENTTQLDSHKHKH